MKLNKKQKFQIKKGLGIFFIILGIFCLSLAVINFIMFLTLENNAEQISGNLMDDLGEIFVFSAIGSNYLVNVFILFPVSIIFIIVGLIVIPK